MSLFPAPLILIIELCFWLYIYIFNPTIKTFNMRYINFEAMQYYMTRIPFQVDIVLVLYCSDIILEVLNQY